MPKVKIYLEKGETIEEAEELLRKALDLHSSGDIHVEESYDDPAMIHTQERMEEIHNKIYDEMLQEVIEAINEEY